MLKENLKYKGDILLVAYIDFETTAPSGTCLDPENRNLYAVSYVIIFAFHPDLPQIDCIIIERSFGHSLQKLNDLGYLTCDQLYFISREQIQQLKDCARSVYKKKKKIAFIEMFSCELKVSADWLLKWFNAKIKSNHLELSLDAKGKYEIENPIDSQ